MASGCTAYYAPRFGTVLKSTLIPNGNGIKTVQLVPSGIAVVPATNDGEEPKDSAQALAQTFNGLCTKKAEPWVKLIVPRAPVRIQALADNGLSTTIRTISQEELRVEVATAFGCSPAQLSWAVPNDIYPGARSALVALRCKELVSIPARVTLFCVQLLVYLRRQRPNITQCGICLGFHRLEHCVFRRRCSLCASYTHTEEEHLSVDHIYKECSITTATYDCRPRCGNCKGPHSAPDLSCPLRVGILSGFGPDLT